MPLQDTDPTPSFGGFGLSDLWEEVELEYALVVRTSFEDAEDE